MFTLNNGKEFPLIGLGTYRIQGTTLIRSVIDAALEAGYRSFDSASVYGNEKDIGLALAELLPKYNLQRSDVYITTKLSPSDQGRDKARNAVFKSLGNLKLSYIDLYLIHWPGAGGVDNNSPENSKLRKESWQDMVDLYKEGILKSIGVSNYTVRHLTELLADCAGVPPAVNQVEYHPKHKQLELSEFCKKNNILLQAYFSLGGTGHASVLLQDKSVLAIANRLQKTPAQVLLKWGLQNGAAVIPKSVMPSRIAANFNLNFKLDPEDMRMLNDKEETEKLSWNPDTIL